jgi:CheY-like chemotaxis protein
MEYPCSVAVTRIHLVDDEPSVHQLVRTILKRGDYAVETFLGPAQALRKAKESPPDLIVTDVLMPMIDGWTFVKQLRATPSLALVPVIFLTSQSSTEDYIRGFRLGADDYLDKSTEFWELGERVAKALARRRELEETVGPASSAREQPSGGLRGKFDQIGLASLLTVLDLGKRGGVLRVKRPQPSEEGVLYLVDGRVHRADLARKEVRDREAIYTLLGWSDGTFEFSAEKLRVMDQVGLPTTELLLEGARRIDERRPRV